MIAVFLALVPSALIEHERAVFDLRIDPVHFIGRPAEHDRERRPDADIELINAGDCNAVKT